MQALEHALSCQGAAQTFFRGELFAALRILRAGHVAPERLVGSWAGAFGHYPSSCRPPTSGWRSTSSATTPRPDRRRARRTGLDRELP
ncbi:MAG: lytic murein transglycosylase [Sphaerotilus natans]